MVVSKNNLKKLLLVCRNTVELLSVIWINSIINSVDSSEILFEMSHLWKVMIPSTSRPCWVKCLLDTEITQCEVCSLRSSHLFPPYKMFFVFFPIWQKVFNGYGIWSSDKSNQFGHRLLSCIIILCMLHSAC